MKKIAILTALLALTACGGGSGGGSGSSSGGNTYRSAVNQDTIDSNTVITAMVSESVEDSAGNFTNNIGGRAATPGKVQHNGKEYTAYRLDDVDFKAIITSGYANKVKLGVDSNGKINKIVFDNYEGWKPNSFDNSGSGSRKGETASFDVKLKGADNSMTVDYVSYAKELGLSYSDFGVLKFHTADGIMALPFAGGYDVKKIDKSEIASNMTFTGTAAGSVTRGEGTPVNLEDKNATLVFDKASGEQTLAASFTNWYDINATKHNNGTTTFAVDANGKTIDPNIQIPVTPVANLENSDFKVVDGNTHVVYFETNYYGDNNTPEEASALLQYQFCDSGECKGNPNNINLMMGFGGKAN